MAKSNEIADILVVTETPANLSEYLDPKNDYAFKRLFGSKRFKRLTIHLLNDCLNKVGEERIVRIKFLATILEPDVYGEKQSIVDVLCRDAKGNRFVVEMQCRNQTAFMKRMQFYGAKAYIHQLEKAEGYKSLKKITMIVIADFDAFPRKESYKTVHRTLDVHTYEHDLDGVEYVVISLSKLKEKFSKLNKEEIKNLTPIEKWCYFFICATQITDKELVMALAEKDKIMKEAFEGVKRSLWTEEELRGYSLAERNRMDDEAIMDYAEKQARKKGRAEGREEGKAEGKAEGRTEIAKNLLSMGLNTNAIGVATGLDISVVEALKKEVAENINHPVFF